MMNDKNGGWMAKKDCNSNAKSTIMLNEAVEEISETTQPSAEVLVHTAGKVAEVGEVPCETKPTTSISSITDHFNGTLSDLSLTQLSSKVETGRLCCKSEPRAWLDTEIMQSSPSVQHRPLSALQQSEESALKRSDHSILVKDSVVAGRAPCKIQPQSWFENAMGGLSSTPQADQPVEANVLGQPYQDQIVVLQKAVDVGRTPYKAKPQAWLSAVLSSDSSEQLGRLPTRQNSCSCVTDEQHQRTIPEEKEKQMFIEPEKEPWFEAAAVSIRKSYPIAKLTKRSRQDKMLEEPIMLPTTHRSQVSVGTRSNVGSRRTAPLRKSSESRINTANDPNRVISTPSMAVRNGTVMSGKHIRNHMHTELHHVPSLSKDDRSITNSDSTDVRRRKALDFLDKIVTRPSDSRILHKAGDRLNTSHTSRRCNGTETMSHEMERVGSSLKAVGMCIKEETTSNGPPYKAFLQEIARFPSRFDEELVREKQREAESREVIVSRPETNVEHGAPSEADHLAVKISRKTEQPKRHSEEVSQSPFSRSQGLLNDAIPQKIIRFVTLFDTISPTQNEQQSSDLESRDGLCDTGKQTIRSDDRFTDSKGRITVSDSITSLSAADERTEDRSQSSVATPTKLSFASHSPSGSVDNTDSDKVKRIVTSSGEIPINKEQPCRESDSPGTIHHDADIDGQQCFSEARDSPHPNITSDSDIKVEKNKKTIKEEKQLEEGELSTCTEDSCKDSDGDYSDTDDCMSSSSLKLLMRHSKKHRRRIRRRSSSESSESVHERHHHRHHQSKRKMDDHHCRYCKMDFVLLSERLYHEISSHRFEHCYCRPCGIYLSEGKMDTHMRKSHRSQLYCFCGFKADTRWAIARHKEEDH